MAKGRTKSPYFPQKRTDQASCLPFPPLAAPSFGLIQEILAHDPFRLLIATIFLNRTRGEVAIPVLHAVFEKYPTVSSLASADVDELVSMIRKLGFQNARANKCIGIAQLWLASPPIKGRRFRKLHYPNKSDGLDIKPGECVDDHDDRVAWEVAHFHGIGAYAIDSWRIFCRDVLRGEASDWNGGGSDDGFVPEWKSVQPKDKELRAFLTWMWLKEGWAWNAETGEKTRATKSIRRMARRGGLVVEKNGSWILEEVALATKPPALAASQ
ncbi:Methyl-CpG-binding domain protein 5 [Ophidiomyces ophidiicola]|nr:Methyl-CpG-binding domain protein 5 [Ophidiomyces ophidiicola]KAI1991732.1 Methyl-CpG-binding domain protein 5 [Ophidiomyces ophidiicola]KAI1994520.1 Methyl-CpG-binding domain protein 5 [Ophidiomyces ophidiicola]KAI1997780.1 Methyl-CpG-binding domain protein 5 [Ophidiomyces ophidiicola]